MLTDLIIFAVVFVALLMVANMVMFIITMKLFTSKKFVKKYTKMILNMSNEIAEEMEDEL